MKIFKVTKFQQAFLKHNFSMQVFSRAEHGIYYVKAMNHRIENEIKKYLYEN